MTQETTDQYNGWTNRESWCMGLWLSNDEGMYNAAREVVASARDSDMGRGEALEDWVNELKDQREHNIAIDTMFDDVGSLWRVDWPEVAASLTDE